MWKGINIPKWYKNKKQAKNKEIGAVCVVINEFTLTNIILIVSSLISFVVGLGYGVCLNKLKDEYNEE